MFTWIPFFESLASALRPWRARQPELIALLESAQRLGIPVTRTLDRDASGQETPLTEIDPFTFLGAINRGITDDNRRKLCRHLGAALGVGVPVPADFHGVPVLNNQSSWFFAYRAERHPEDVPRLWDVFERAIEVADAPGTPDLTDARFAAAFDAALRVRQVNVNLTIGLFWIRPRTFLSLDRWLRNHLGLTLPARGYDARWYADEVAAVRARGGLSFAEISAAAWNTQGQGPNATPPAPPAVPPDTAPPAAWFVGAYWADEPTPDQTARFLSEGIWENGYPDRYLDEVRQIRPGDLIAIKSSSVQKHALPFDAGGRTVSKMDVKAVGTVLANRGDGRRLEVEWVPLPTARTWYFYTSRNTIWRLRAGHALADRLRRFAFDGEPQDHAFFQRWWWGDEASHGDASAPEDRSDAVSAAASYGSDDLRAEGVFLTDAEVERALRRLRLKKNLILQGAPGTGKTFCARKLAYLLMEARDPARVEMVQFHPSTSYEDFVRGYRPSGETGGLTLRDGPFLELCRRAEGDERPHVLIVDEINRGNLPQILGELLVLLEADKRGSAHGLTPLYPRTVGERLCVPSNLYVIGTMNLADRSLALVDFALRRRFAFQTLRPAFGAPAFKAWLRGRSMAPELIERIVRRMEALNRHIADDQQLGMAFEIGHSFFCPAGTGSLEQLGEDWYRDVVETELFPLLEEYWHDPADQDRLATARALLDGPR